MNGLKLQDTVIMYQYPMTFCSKICIVANVAFKCHHITRQFDNYDLHIRPHQIYFDILTVSMLL